MQIPLCASLTWPHADCPGSKKTQKIQLIVNIGVENKVNNSQFVLLSVPGCEISRSPPLCPAAACHCLGRGEELKIFRNSEFISINQKNFICGVNIYYRGISTVGRATVYQNSSEPRRDVKYDDWIRHWNSRLDLKLHHQTDSCQTFSRNGLWIMIIVSQVCSECREEICRIYK